MLLVTAALAANGQNSTVAAGPAPHPLGAVIATSLATFRSIAHVRPLLDGRVLVQDAGARTVTLLDAALGSAVVVLDSASGRSNSYGSLPGALLPFFGDSSLFYDGASNALLVLDPTAPGGPSRRAEECGGNAPSGRPAPDRVQRPLPQQRQASSMMFSQAFRSGQYRTSGHRRCPFRHPTDRRLQQRHSPG